MIRILTGDCLTVLRRLEAESVSACVTSPPYYGVRDFNVKPTKWKDGWVGCLGLEPNVGMFIAHIVEVFDAVWRVLRKDGTLWLNMGDSYANRPCGWAPERYEGRDDRTFRVKPTSTMAAGGRAKTSNGRMVDWGFRSEGVNGTKVLKRGLKEKDLIGMPWRVALALQEAGWYLRSDVIWHKLNPMPESVYDRPIKSHEYLFQLTKSGRTLCWRHRDGRWVSRRPAADIVWRHRITREERRSRGRGKDWIKVNLWRGFDYYYEHEAVREAASPNSHARTSRKPAPAGRDDQNGHHGTIHRNGRRPEKLNGRLEQGLNAATKMGRGPGWRKLAPHDVDGPRTKQNISFDAAIGSSIVLPTRNRRSVWSIATKPFKDAHFATFPPALIEPCIKASCPPGGLVLDCFGGAGTTGVVADQLGRDAVLIEINRDYARMARQRIGAARAREERVSP